MARNTMSPQMRQLLEAVQTTPRPTLRALMAKTGRTSTSAVKYQLERLAERGEVVITYDDHDRMHVENGADFCQAWDMAARLAGNGEA